MLFHFHHQSPNHYPFVICWRGCLLRYLRVGQESVRLCPHKAEVTPRKLETNANSLKMGKGVCTLVLEKRG